ncbi:uncharacterized protein LOC119766443 [Culex quinquefasciatus]|uniref:uncharacterized protein LOC119766443 n=1 Tax=Culex quinquefasciatus TaxID=7176 RepID=UPI0018E3D03F|nr:uncharacterized protein LOC119766443 [Culex quinquefasciatus]
MTDSLGWWPTKPARTCPNHSIVVDHIDTAGVGGVSYANTRMTNASIGHTPEPVGRTTIKRSRIPNSNISIMNLFERKRSKLAGWYLPRLPHPRQSVQNKTDSHKGNCNGRTKGLLQLVANATHPNGSNHSVVEDQINTVGVVGSRTPASG